MQAPNLVKLVRLDAAAAFAASVTLFVLHHTLSAWLGLPAKVLIGQAMVALCYGVFGVGWLLSRRKSRALVYVLAAANVLYAFACLFLLFQFHGDCTGWGSAYFLFDAAIVGVLAAVEFRTLNKLT